MAHESRQVAYPPAFGRTHCLSPGFTSEAYRTVVEEGREAV